MPPRHPTRVIEHLEDHLLLSRLDAYRMRQPVVLGCVVCGDNGVSAAEKDVPDLKQSQHGGEDMDTKDTPLL